MKLDSLLFPTKFKLQRAHFLILICLSRKYQIQKPNSILGNKHLLIRKCKLRISNLNPARVLTNQNSQKRFKTQSLRICLLRVLFIILPTLILFIPAKSDFETLILWMKSKNQIRWEKFWKEGFNGISN